MGTHEDLDVWKLSIDFVEEIYILTKNFPSDEKYGLTIQLRRAAISIPSNIAEGAARKSSKENIQFLHIALGSIAEIETQLIIAERLEFSDTQESQKHIKIIKSKLINLLKYLKTLGQKENF
jgi:four helix bundle protein